MMQFQELREDVFNHEKGAVKNGGKGAEKHIERN
jgi:hypothetical protein